jgi:hypothetical protein
VQNGSLIGAEEFPFLTVQTPIQAEPTAIGSQRFILIIPFLKWGYPRLGSGPLRGIMIY